MADSASDFTSAIRAAIRSEIMEINTSIQGEIVSYAGGFATVKPLGRKRFADGDELEFPNVERVPVRWPVFAGGLAGVRGPVRAGDKCLLVFSQQADDGSDDMRRFDLTDAYAVIVDNSQQSQGGNDNDMVMYFGAAYIKLTEGGALEINAPGGTKHISPTNEFTGNNTVAGTETVQGKITGAGGMGITGGTGVSISGNIDSTGGITNNGKNIGSGHTHSGVQTGGGNTGGVV